MSKRCELQKEYHKEFGNYKGSGKYTDHYVNWLESRILALTIPDVVELKGTLCDVCGSENTITVSHKGENCDYCNQL